MAIACPDPRHLVRLGTPDVGDVTAAGYDEHVENCPACQNVLRMFVDDGLESASRATSKVTVPDEFPRIPGFTIERFLGRGAAGVVYLARQDRIERPVALKLVPGGHAAGDRERRRWLREAKAASQVRHSHVVTLYAFGEVPPWSYLALEFIPGGTLRDRLSGPLPPRTAARLVEVVARAVQQIHDDGFYHLDLKPSNILLEGDENTPWDEVIPKVSDFGIARVASEAMDSVSAAGLLGTPAYMAPEQAGKANTPIGPAADVYALGAILYELLTGRPPIQRVSVVETLDAICNQEPIAPRRVNPTVSRDLETICLKCLRKDPRHRYEDSEALADDLRRARNGWPIAARPVSVTERAWRSCRRNPVVAGLSAGFALLAACGLVTLIALLNQARSEKAEAEANRQIASDALRDTTGLYGLIARRNHELYLKKLSSLRRHQQQLYYARSSDRSAGQQLLNINIMLADELMGRHGFAEAQPIIEECLAIMANVPIADHRGDDPRFEVTRCRSYLSDMFWHQKRYEEALRQSERACEMLDRIDATDVPDPYFHFAVTCHLQVGQLLSFNLGKADDARQWLKDRERWLDALTSREANNPSHLSLHGRWLLAAGDNEKALDFLRAAVRSHPKDVDLVRMLAEELIPAADRMPFDERRAKLLNEARVALTSVVEVAELAAVNSPGNIDVLYTFGHMNYKHCYCLVQLGRRDEAIAVYRRLVLDVKSLQARHPVDQETAVDFWREMANITVMMRPFLHAEQAPLDVVRTSLQEMGFHSRSEGEFGWCVTLAEHEIAALMRRLGQRAEAKQQVAQMVNYAHELVTRYPGDPYAYLALSLTQIEVFKNAVRYDDADREAALIQALSSSERALAISPGNAKAQEAVTDCRDRLERLRSEPKAAATAAP